MKKHKIMPLVLSLTTLALVACGASSGEEVEYTFTITAQNGMPLEDSGVKLYKGKKLQATGWTDEKGVATVKAPKGEYTVKTQLKEGFHATKALTTNKEELVYTINAESSLIDDEIPEEYFLSNDNSKKEYFNVYDVMYDVTFTTTQLKWTKDSKGYLKSEQVTEEIKFSDILKTKKAIMLNFWYVNCSWCQYEFPYIQEAYDEYEDDIAVLAFDYQDDMNSIFKFQDNNEYTFNMIYDEIGLTSCFPLTGFPTSVIIDRYGMITWSQTTFASTADVKALWAEYTADDYQPTWKEDSSLPDKPTYEWPDMDRLTSVANSSNCNATFRKEEGSDAEYNWPWLISETEGAIYPSNAGHHNSYSIIYVDVHLNEEEVFAFDYKSSSEKGGDILYILLDGKIIKKISGVMDKYELMELYVANETRDYEFAFCFMKDESSLDGDDTVYLRNFQVYPLSQIKTPTYILRDAAYGGLNDTTGMYNKYITPVFNEEDGYYHVGTADGKLLLAELTQTTNFDPNSTVYVDISSYQITDPQTGTVVNDTLMKYVTMAGNTLEGYVPVNKELKTYLDMYIRAKGGKGHENEWLELCYYYDNYGGAIPFQNPVGGLSKDTAFTAHLGEENYATFNRTLMPRGLCFNFTAEQEGIYHFYSLGENAAVAWYFDENYKQFYESQFDEREVYWAVEDQFGAMAVFHDYIYLEANQTITLRVGFEDIYLYATLQFGIEYTEKTGMDIFKYCSPGYYTSAVDAKGEVTGEIISTGIETAVGEDGYYHEKLSDGTLGSIVYCDFIYPTPLLQYSIYDCVTNSKIKDEAGGKPLDFTNVEDDTEAKPMPKEYKRDLTNEFKSYFSKIDGSSKPHSGCVPVDEKLHDMLQMVSGKYGFYTEKGWQKLCYYYDHIGK